MKNACNIKNLMTGINPPKERKPCTLIYPTIVCLERSNYFTVAKFCFIPNLAANEVICILANNFYVN